jgi:hypothetical protein
MLAFILSLSLAALANADDSARREAQALVDTIESLQKPVDDFRCEYEGTLRARGRVAEEMMIGEEEVYDSYGGVFIWKKGGDTHIESWHRETVNTQIRRESIVVRTKPRQAEQYSRFHEGSINASRSSDPNHVQTWHSTMGTIFLIDKIKREVADPGYDSSVSDDRVDGRPLNVLSIALSGVPNSLLCRYWIDLGRNGHVVRQDTYLGQLGLSGRLDIKLAPFQVGKAQVWMPVSGESVGYAALVDRKPAIMKEPQTFEKISVVSGTMAFNKHPGPEVFTLKYTQATPSSENLHGMENEYRRQKSGSSPIRPEFEKKFLERRAKAETQTSTPLVASPAEGLPWSSWLAWGFGTLVVVSSVALLIQRRRR